jgi:hypothetical protein
MNLSDFQLHTIRMDREILHLSWRIIAAKLRRTATGGTVGGRAADGAKERRVESTVGAARGSIRRADGGFRFE